MPAELSKRLADRFRWIDPGPAATHLVSDSSGWWRDGEILAAVGPALADPHRPADPTVVVAPETAGLLLGPLVAVALGVGFVPAHKRLDGRLIAGPTTWATSPSDYRGRTVTLGVRDRHLAAGDRVLVLDDWVDSGAQLHALYDVIRRLGAEPVGSAAIVAGCPPGPTAELRLTSLLRADQLSGSGDTA